MHLRTPLRFHRCGKRTHGHATPSLLYAALIPSFAYEDFLTPDGEEVYAHEGGLFWDGRARDLFEQVQQPFFNHKEMNLSSESELAHRLRRSSYSHQLKSWLGNDTGVTMAWSPTTLTSA